MFKKSSQLILFFLSLTVAFCSVAKAEEGESKPLQIETYKPMYFIAGHPDTKIELSFKVKLIEAGNLYFGYTQLMFWELFQKDVYFHEINYNPEIFYRYYLNDSSHGWIDFGIYEHESNGTGGENERAWNRSSIRYHSQDFVSANSRIFWEAKAWIPYWYHPGDFNIVQYRGLGEFNITWAGFLGSYFSVDDLSLRIYLGGKSEVNPLQGGQELTLRLKSAGRKFLPLVIFQVFHGYAENLIDYQKDQTGIRAGIGF